MLIKIINNKDSLWDCYQCNESTVLFKGHLWYKDKFFSGKTACYKIQSIFSNFVKSEIQLKQKMAELKGHFSFIIEYKDFIIAVVDKIRSYPIFYGKKGNIFCISNSAINVQTELDLHKKNELSLIEFQMAGYVTGKKTLLQNIFQLQTGEAIIIDKNIFKISTIQYYMFYSESVIGKSNSELMEDLHYVTLKTFNKLIESLNGRPVWIPLSGGLDSRLVLSMLYDLKYDNITTFSYGMRGLFEINRAKKIANFLNIQWYHIPYKPREIKKIYHSKFVQDYLKFSCGLCSVPFLNDFYALLKLQSKKLIPQDAVIINGQSGDFLTGDHIPKILGDKDDDLLLDTKILTNAIINKHFSLWLNKKTNKNLEIISNRILSDLNIIQDSQLLKSQIAKLYEMYEYNERQAKFVVNGQRVYEWFGFEWRLPLWSDELIDFWVSIPWDKKTGQKLYKMYLKKYNPASIFNIRLSSENTSFLLFVRLIKKLIFIISKLRNDDAEKYYRKYTKYFDGYAPFYPHKKYKDFLKDSQWHRNVISYQTTDILHLLSEV